MSKHYDLEERTFQFAKNVSLFIKKFTRTISNIEYGKQVVRSSGSVGANYIEANEALSKKDLIPITKWFWEFEGTRLPEILIFRLNKTRVLVMLSRGFCD